MKVDLKSLRAELHNKQNQICPILRGEFEIEKMVIDHDHSTGFIRGCINFQANSLEGKILSDYKRTGVSKLIDLPSFLRNLADYLTDNMSHLKMVHPTAMPAKPKLTKSSYNKLKKLHSGALPKYTGNLTKPLQKLFNKYSIEPKFYA